MKKGMSLNDVYFQWKLDPVTYEDDFGRALQGYVKAIILKHFWKWKDRTDDLIGECLCEILKDMNNRDTSKSKFTTWVYTVVHHTCLDMLRKRGNHPEQGLLGNETVKHENRKFDHLALQSLLGKLSEESQIIVRMKLEGYSHEGIAERLGMEVNTVNNRWTRIQRQLRTLWVDKT